MRQSKQVLITGSSSGFGYLLALLYARNGHKTYASVRNLDSEGAKQLKHIAKSEKLPLTVLLIDVTDDKTIHNALKEINSPIDILINNAGFGYLGPVEDHTVDEIKEQYETNIFGVIRMVKAVVPEMRDQRRGMIINIGSINGIIPFPLWGVYSSSKFAIETLTEALRFELSHFGIKVVLIEPGSFLTKFTDNKKNPKQMMSEASPYKHLTTRFFERFYKAKHRVSTSILGPLLDPSRVVNKIYSLSLSKNPSLRHRIGYDAHVYYVVRKVLPHFLWEMLMKRVYKW